MVPDVSVQATYAALQANPRAVLVDVRTPPEWAYVGTPSVSNCLRIALTAFPPTQVDPSFVAQVEASVAKDQPIYCLCKVGGRSQTAAQLLQAAGYGEVYNVAHGFDGDQNAQGQRRSTNGWIAAGLPWHQD